MHFRWSVLAIFLITLGCVGTVSQSGVDGEIDADSENRLEKRTINIPDGEGLSTSCDADGPYRDLCRAERGCLEGSGESCHEAAMMWEDGTVRTANDTWAYLFFRRGCSLGHEGCCEELGVEPTEEPVIAETEEPAEPVEDVEEVEPEEEEPVEPSPIISTKEREPPFVTLEDGSIKGVGLPAVSRDAEHVAHLALYLDSRGSQDAAVLVIIETATDEIVFQETIATADEFAEIDDREEEIAGRIEEGNDKLEEIEWEEMALTSQGPEVVRDCEHVEETDDGEVCVQKLTAGKVEVRYAEPYITTDEKETTVKGWSAGSGCPAYIASAATGPGGSLLFVEIRYDCRKSKPQFHVLKTK